MNTLYMPVEQGGEKLLSLTIRNEVIELMKVKRFLNTEKTIPTWAKIADALIEMNLNKKWKVKKNGTYQNIFLQTLTVNTRKGGEDLSKSLKRMIKVANKHRVCIPPTKLESETRLSMPI